MNLMKMCLIILSLALCSCGVVKAPVRLAGGLAKGTAKLGKAAVTKPKEAYDKRQARKKAEQERAETREAAARDRGGRLGTNDGMGSGVSLGGSGPSLDFPPPAEQEPPLPPESAE